MAGTRFDVLRRHLPVALLGLTLLATVGGSFVAWSMINRAAAADARARTAADLAGRYAGASSAVADVQAAETRFVFMPSADGMTQLHTSQAGLDRAIATVRAAAATDADRAAPARMEADDARMDTAIAQMVAAVRNGDAGAVTQIESTAVRPAINQMRSLIERERAEHSAGARAGLAHASAADARLGSVALIVTGLSAGLMVVLLVMLRLRRRLGQAQ